MWWNRWDGVVVSDDDALRDAATTDDAIRDGYDRLASRYADELSDELDGKPLDRWLPTTVAREAVGEIRRRLRLAGSARDRGPRRHRGLDLSPQMIAVANALPRFASRSAICARCPTPIAAFGAVVAMYAL